MIEKIELDGVDYPILSEKETDGATNVVKFKVMLDDKEHELQAQYSNIMLDDLKVICGLNAEEELRNILEHELKLEIYQHVYQTTIREQNDKLNQLIETDPIFASYIRNFYSESNR